ncbi:MAG: hypothetical protein QNJ85_19315 [Gammaproteobacteria bacterium]|nr:hypothetical protein [Gammaproteobacteria bacterium]
MAKRCSLLCLCALLVAGCGTASLGDIDETQSERDAMPGPGVFTGEDGVASLQWGGENAAAEQGTEAADSRPAASAPAPPEMDEQAEFEAYKEWRRLRAEGAESEEYQEFLLWLEFRQFKATAE